MTGERQVARRRDRTVARLAAVSAGSGPAVVFLHGLAGFKEIWREQLVAVAPAGFRVLALDLRGHGASPTATSSWTIEEMAEDVLTCLDELDVPRAAVVGHSMGGRVMFRLALAHPERVWAIIPVGAQSEAPAPPYREVLRRLRGETALGGLQAFWVGFDAAGEIPRRVERDRAYGSWFRGRFARNRPHALVAALDAILAMPSLTGRLGEITVPSLAVVGSDDEPFLDLARRYEGLMPSSRTAVIPRCGHYPMVDAATEFTRLLLSFLREAGTAL